MKKQKKLTSYLKQVFILTIIFLSFNKIKAPIACTTYVSRNTGMRYVTKPIQNIKEEINIKNFTKNINQFIKKENEKNSNHKKFFLKVLKKISPKHKEKLKQFAFKKSNKEKTPVFTVKENEYIKKIALNKLNKFRTAKKRVLNEENFFEKNETNEKNDRIKKLKKELTLSPAKCFYNANLMLKNLSGKEKKLMKKEKVLNEENFFEKNETNDRIEKLKKELTLSPAKCFYNANLMLKNLSEKEKKLMKKEKVLNEEIIKKYTNKLNKKSNLITGLNIANLNSLKK